MCLCLPHVPHHNTIVVEKEEQLENFRPVQVSFRRRLAVIALYVPHHNTVIVSSKKPSESNSIDYPSSEYMDEKQHLRLQLESGGFKGGIRQKKEQLEVVKNDIIKSINSKLALVKADQ